MVNLTHSFTQTFGRPPSEEEIGEMMILKREQEGWKRHKPEKKDMTTTKTLAQKRIREPKPPSRVRTNEPQYRWPKRATQMALRINRALLRQTTIENIAFIEDVSQSRIMQEIRKWDLPRVSIEE